jgi:[protein-PII] uridylyltransferase
VSPGTPADSAWVVPLPRLPAAVPRSGISDPARLALRQWLGDVDRALADAFREGKPVQVLVRARAAAVRKLLAHVWLAIVGESPVLALFAVGGFGRGELFPQSDVDLLVLCEEAPTGSLARSLETLFTGLWDLGLKPGHALRTLAQCRELASKDITVYTSLLDAERIGGSAQFDAGFAALVLDERVCSRERFFLDKREEQTQRFARFNDTAYNLEPNLKEGPGGLRSLHLMEWLGKKLFGAKRLADVVEYGLLGSAELDALEAGRLALWRDRFALHLLARRPEERLLFDYQRELAFRLGYVDEHAQNLGVEQFMQDYFRAAITLQRANEQFLQRCEEALVPAPMLEARPLSDGFMAVGARLDTREADLFVKRPAALIEAFAVLAENPDVKGLRADVLQRLQAALALHGDVLRDDAAANAAFLRLLRLGAPAVEALARMSRFGVLARYLPAFGRVVGRMQYDLFHVYTVDEHTLRVLRHVARYAQAESARDFALGHALFSRLEKPELLLLAALFHDIAKGRGGDHSELGEVDGRDFCTRLGLPLAEVDTVAWLVRWHLLMSVTAQRQDITDADVVHRFAVQVADWERLDLLYLLTCADIAGTSPKLWNSWKDRLMADLYAAARYSLRAGLERPPHADERVASARAEARAMLAAEGVDLAVVDRLWADFPAESFLRYRPAQIAWQTRGIARTPDSELPLVLVAPRSVRGGSEVFVYARDRDGLFAAVTAALDRLHLSVQEARIVTARSGMSLDTFLVLDPHGRALSENECTATAQALCEVLAQTPYRAHSARRSLARTLKHFHMAPRIGLQRDEVAGNTQLSLVCSDRPGLLAAVAMSLRECGVRVHDARIATFGERVEDFFRITDGQDQPLSAEAETKLRDTLLARVNAQLPAERMPAVQKA